MKVNLTGTPNTDDYQLGRGKLYFAEPGDAAVLGGMRDLGNVPEFQISAETETIEHQSSRRGLKVTDQELIISQKLNVSLSLDEINFDNLKLFMLGTMDAAGTAEINATRAYMANAPGTNTEIQFIANFSNARWYELREDLITGDWTTGYRFLDLDTRKIYGVGDDKPQVTVEVDDDDGLETDWHELTEGVGYEIDHIHGTIFFPANSSAADTYVYFRSSSPNGTSPGVAGPRSVQITVYPHEGTGSGTDPFPAPTETVVALTQGSMKGKLIFIAVNPADEDHESEFVFEQVNLKPQGELSLIGDEYTTIQLTGVAEVGDNGRTLTCITHRGKSQPSWVAS